MLSIKDLEVSKELDTSEMSSIIAGADVTIQSVGTDLSTTGTNSLFSGELGLLVRTVGQAIVNAGIAAGRGATDGAIAE